MSLSQNGNPQKKKKDLTEINYTGLINAFRITK